MNDDSQTAFGKRHHSVRSTTDRIGAVSLEQLRPQFAERRLLMVLLPMFTFAATASWASAELEGTARWFERFVLMPCAGAFLVLLLWNWLTPPSRVWRVRVATLFVGPALILVDYAVQLWELYSSGFDPKYYFNLSPWLILCSALFLFLLPSRVSWRFAIAYWAVSVLMLGVFLMFNSRVLPPFVHDEMLLNTVIAPPVFIALLSAFTRMRSDYTKARTHAEDLRELALLDALTGLQNRRAFRQSFKRAKARQLRNKTPLCAMLLDIDHFKRINDTYGHQVGDEVLVRLANVLTRELRGTDEVFRWGGEEFMVLLEETPGEHLELVAERVRTAVEAEQLLDKSTITISIGATHILPAEQDEVVYPRADEALYASKRDGRNRVTIIDAPDSARTTADFQP
ncbi:MAG: GGDEF domain-containing protein [Planctomycetes bacterium]|nr:GGDEF domain-containing protein [Planctomycetota bacterium]